MKRPYALGLETRKRTVHVHEQAAKVRPHEPATSLVQCFSYVTEPDGLEMVLAEGIDGIDEVVERGAAVLADQSHVMTLPDQFTHHLSDVYPAPRVVKVVPMDDGDAHCERLALPPGSGELFEKTGPAAGRWRQRPPPIFSRPSVH